MLKLHNGPIIYSKWVLNSIGNCQLNANKKETKKHVIKIKSVERKWSNYWFEEENSALAKRNKLNVEKTFDRKIVENSVLIGVSFPLNLFEFS